MTHRSILHVDLDCFFAAAEVARNPSLRGKPVIVGGGPVKSGPSTASTRGIVATASYEARAFGVKTAMPLAQARRLCPQAVCLPVDFHHYEDLSRRFHAILAAYTPDIEPLGLDEAFLDLTGCEPVVGDAPSAAASIRQRVRGELSITCSIGLASAKVVAKVASDLAKPDGFLAVPPGQETAFLAPLPVGDLPMVGQGVQKALAQLGVATIGELAHYPVLALHRRFGILGRLIWLHANGIDPSPVHGRGPAKSVSREVTFPYDITDPDFLRATLRVQAERVGHDLREDGVRARCVRLKLRYGDFTTISRSHTLPLPTSADHLLHAAAVDLLDQALAHDRRAVRLIGMGAANLVSAAQLPLPDGHADRLGPSGSLSPGQRWEDLSRSLDRIRQKYGEHALETGRTRWRSRFIQLKVR